MDFATVRLLPESALCVYTHNSCSARPCNVESHYQSEVPCCMPPIAQHSEKGQQPQVMLLMHKAPLTQSCLLIPLLWCAAMAMLVQTSLSLTPWVLALPPQSLCQWDASTTSM